MAWELDSDRPIFIQIVERIQMEIISGKYSPGDKLPSVRDLAAVAAVNPNTMQKALSELEREGVLYSQRTSGRFVAEQKTGGTSMREELSQKHIQAFVDSMRTLGYADGEIVTVLKGYLHEEGAHE